MKHRLKLFVIVLITATIACSCKKNHYRVNTSSIETDIKIKRLEKDLFSISPDKVVDAYPG